MHDTLALLEVSDFPNIKRDKLNTLQVNITYQCNQRCLHCHVNASPDRTEMMSNDLIDLIVPVMQAQEISQLDLTGGAPEMHPRFRYLVKAARAANIHVIDRCNLTILSEPGYEYTADFLADHQVEVVASLPCYAEDNVDKQRGNGVFERSIKALQSLNNLGYGMSGSSLLLNLVYNPQGPSLPPSQKQLEADYKKHLFEQFGIHFNQLFTITNMPIKRFGSTLVSKNTFTDYMELLKTNFSDDNLKHVMCRSLVSVDWQGYLYDCDFNQQLALPLSSKKHLNDLLSDSINGNSICVADHCFACTAGQGSSCGGAL